MGRISYNPPLEKSQNISDLYQLIINNLTDTVWVASPDYRFIWVSPSVSQQRGYSSVEMLQIPLNRQMSSSSFKNLHDFITRNSTVDQIKNKAVTGTIEMELLRKDGSSFWSEEKLSVLYNSNGLPVHIIGIGRDISSRKRTEIDLIRSERLYHNLFEYFPTGMYRTTPQGNIIEANPALINLLKAKNKGEVIGKNAREFFLNPDDRQKQQKRLEEENIILRSELQMKCFDGSIIFVRDNARVVRDNEGNVQFYEGNLEDITNERNAELALRASEERYRTLVSNMSEGLTIVDTNEIVLFSNSTADEMFGVQTGTMRDRNLRDFLDPLQYQAVRQQTLFRLKGQRSIYEIEIKRPDGQIRNLQITATPQMNERGEIVSSFGVIHDITQRKRNELVIQQTQAQLSQQLRENELRRQELTLLTQLGNVLQSCSGIQEIFPILRDFLKRLFTGCSGSFFIADETGQTMKKSIAWGNQTISENPIQISECWSLQLHPPKMYQTKEVDSNPFCGHTIRDKAKPSSTVCQPILSGDKIIGMINLSSSSDQNNLSDVQAKLCAAIGEQLSLVISNISLREKLHQQAIRDPLTGMYNRYYLEESFENEIERARRGKYSLGIIMLDFDNFKVLNTNCGHPKVDEMLTQFGRLVRSEFRSSDLCCRYGGDEFLIILPETTIDITFARAEKLRGLVKQLSIIKNKKIFPISISIGVAEFPDHGQTIGALITTVDEALLKAKVMHDCVQIASSN